MTVMVGIIGLGHVGRLTVQALQISAVTVGYDVALAEPYPTAELAACDFVVVCVNTPSAPDGAADLSQVRSALAALPGEQPVILRSTVPPGTTEALQEEFGREVYFWPEYIGETRFVISTFDVLSDVDPFLVVGGDRSPGFGRWIDFLAQNYGPLTRIHQCTSREAELVKYMENAYFAMKTTFVNEFRRLSEAVGADWHTVREGWLLDPRVERDHSDAFKGAPGYAGKCLPKDTAALIAFARAADIPLPLLESVRDINDGATELAR